MEIWKPIKGYETSYMISNLGNIKSLERCVIRKNGVKCTFHERILSTQSNGRGYLKVSLWRDNKEKQTLVHRLVAEHFLPPPKEGQTDVNHINSIRSDNHVNNLEWATRSENMKHAVKSGFFNHALTKVSATENPNKAKKLTKEAVDDMRKLRCEGWTYKAIGKKYDVSRQMASFICSGKSWR